MKILVYTGLCVLLLSLGSAIAADGDDRSKVGEARPTWKDLPGVDDKNHSLEDLKGKDAVVVAVTCNHCPIAQQYIDRMKEFAEKECGPNGKVALVAIVVSHEETDRLPRMKEVAKDKGFNFPYLYDESQKVGKAIGATHTPQFFVLNKDRVLVYRGLWDNSVNPARVKNRYVEDAVKAVLEGKTPLVTETRAKGCSISYEE